MGIATGYLWAPGSITADDLIATATYDIGLYPEQTDQRRGTIWLGRDWLAPDNLSDIVDSNQEVIISSSGLSFGYGGPALRWLLRNLTPMMVAYVVSNNLGGAYSAPATICIPKLRHTGQPGYFQAIASREAYTSATPAAGGLDEMKISFVDAVEISPPSSFLDESGFALLLEGGSYLGLE